MRGPPYPSLSSPCFLLPPVPGHDRKQRRRTGALPVLAPPTPAAPGQGEGTGGFRVARHLHPRAEGAPGRGGAAAPCGGRNYRRQRLRLGMAMQGVYDEGEEVGASIWTPGRLLVEEWRGKELGIELI